MILLDRLPVLPFMEPALSRLPGLAPMPPESWIAALPDTAAQLGYRDRLIAERRDEVVACLPEGRAAAAELLEALLGHLAGLSGWEVRPGRVAVPGGGEVAVDRDDPLATAGRIASEDFCLMADPGGGAEYRLVGAVLCFPAHWRLAEKIGRPMAAIHAPVPQYDADIARRVNRVFGVIRTGQPLWRLNWSVTATTELFTPDRTGHRAEAALAGEPLYLRTERQSFVRLPETGAVVFGIRTALAPVASLTTAEARAFAAAIDRLGPEAMEYKGGRALFAALRARLAAQQGVSGED